MELKKIKEFADFMKKENLQELEVSEKDWSIKLVKQQGNIVKNIVMDSKDEFTDKKGEVIRSPLVGVFYASPSPTAKPFIAVGQKVKKGDVICIVEAMKQMNEITADKDGTITEICVGNGDIVEYDAVLFRLASNV